MNARAFLLIALLSAVLAVDAASARAPADWRVALVAGELNLLAIVVVLARGDRLARLALATASLAIIGSLFFLTPGDLLRLLFAPCVAAMALRVLGWRLEFGDEPATIECGAARNAAAKNVAADRAPVQFSLFQLLALSTVVSLTVAFRVRFGERTVAALAMPESTVASLAGLSVAAAIASWAIRRNRLHLIALALVIVGTTLIVGSTWLVGAHLLVVLSISLVVRVAGGTLRQSPGEIFGKRGVQLDRIVLPDGQQSAGQTSGSGP
jgi:hypothetical protein